MKKASILLAAILLIALSACQTKAPVNKSAKNGNGTPALNIIQSSTSTPKATAKVTPKATASAAPTTYNFFTEIDEVASAKNSDVVEIREKMFVAQTNDVYYNADDYFGKTIKYEGIFTAYTWEETGLTYYSVFRYGPGCCGSDGNCGFEVIWDNAYPEPDDWVEAVGTLEVYEEYGEKYLRLALDSLTVLETRGEEYVWQ
ncbi:MAG: hypothetical protein LBN97_08465 [Oscillospiraceae bacterium]|jgi:uncharacterized membrane protein YcgQ (UPF0703/DUF1980 family)|nr:hypothetical protein [Oscillospiraceae bacterium]